MFNISQFLERFKHLETNETGMRSAISDAIHQIVGVNVPLEAISYKNSVISLKIDGALKSELYIKKQKMFDTLKKTLPHLKDIRFS